MLYKYHSPDRKKVFEDRKIRFSQFGTLNDPYESSVLIDDGSYSEGEIGEEFESIRQDVSQIKGKEMRPYSDGAVNSVKAMCSPAGKSEMATKFFETKIGILSLSRNHRNLLMWAHYGNDHKGYVIAFDETHEFFHTSHDESIVPAAWDVRYAANKRVFSKMDLPEIYCEKSIDWAYEEEVRVFKALDEGYEFKIKEQTSDGYSIVLFEVPKEAFKSIYLGAKYDESNLHHDLKNIQMNIGDIPVYRAVIAGDRYQVDFELIQ